MKTDDEDAGFIVSAPGPDGLFGVLEDTGETGDLYIYDKRAKEILAWVQVYRRSPTVDVRSEDVEVSWSSDLGKVAARVFGHVHAIIRVSDRTTMTTGLRDPRNGIDNSDWLTGFTP